MPFRKFFGAKNAPAPVQPIEDEEQDTLPNASDPDDNPVVTEDEQDTDWQTRARAVMPTGASTGSKRAEALYGSADASGPTHFSQAVGCRVTGVDGIEYVD